MLNISFYFKWINLIVKYSENDPRIPDLRLFLPRNSKLFFSSKEIRQTEIICLKIIDYNLSFLNCFDYFDFFLLIGIVEKNEENNSPEKLEKINQQALSILFTYITDLKSLGFSEIQISCGVIKVVRELNKFQNNWINLYKEIFYLEEEDFEDCYESIKS